ncbi:hypothetical protein QBC34DRAFT_66230 [Podospora aff. communis PSN243]|uniref:Uncharacterized protein n=1 Tax=Podospora aff. communis PSN243 TaxID=3040156 RepID=A0AAV9GR49_9PEZI|nr:hypothetical protein QBC34DRAFT_66230 [Podospora aff. communis PSN243]
MANDEWLFQPAMGAFAQKVVRKNGDPTAWRTAESRLMVPNATLGLLSFGTATIPSVPLAVDFCELTRGRAFSAPPRLHRHMLLCCVHPRIARGNQQARGEQQATHPPPFTAMFPLSSSIKSTPTPRPVLSTPSPDKLTLSSFRSVAASPHLGEILALPRTPYGTAPLALPAVDEAKTIARGVALAWHWHALVRNRENSRPDQLRTRAWAAHLSTCASPTRLRVLPGSRSCGSKKRTNPEEKISSG